ncbi:MAG: protein-L-isoaspartate(D-aspartate) O-methyltransferase [Anaerolineales bacterium]
MKKISIWLIFSALIFLLGCDREQNKTQMEVSTITPQKTAVLFTVTPTDDPFLSARERMVQNQIEVRGITDEDVLNVMRITPRHEFVLDRFVNQAYADHALPIEHGQTISQPYIVALMTEVLQVDSGDTVLEIGTGSGYQAAILSELVEEVYTIEIIPELFSSAEARLNELGYENISVRNADGYYGWDEKAPFDAIIVTAAPDHLPQPLIDQLADGGRLVIPIGPIGAVQTLWLFEKQSGELEATNLGGVRFVPFTREP